MILVDATYINTGGGKVLLDYFIEYLFENNKLKSYYFILDKRYRNTILNNYNNFKFINGNEFSRFYIYRKLLVSNKYTSIFSFNNLPPFCYNNNIQVYILFHNTTLISNNRQTSFLKTLKFYLKYYYIQLLNKRRFFWISQTDTVKYSLIKKLKIIPEKISVLPFFNDKKKIKYQKNSNNDFIYISDIVEHKNHKILIKAWEILAKKYNLFPNLILSFDPEKHLDFSNYLNELNNLGLSIKNIGVFNHEEISSIYIQYDYLIFPSLTESFGLPLIESALYDNYIIAADLPYVYDVITPSCTFNPNNEYELAKLISKIINNSKYLEISKLKITNKIMDLIHKLEK